MLKDLIKKRMNKKDGNDKIKFPVMDGFVDIKGFDKDGKMFYHDCGDNVVTDWMRHAIMMMLCGVSFSRVGDKPNFEGHTEEVNPDGYLFNKRQFAGVAPDTTTQYCKSTFLTPEDSYALFPTKILFGTGKEYENWATLKAENKKDNAAWYEKLEKEYTKNGEVDEPSINFDINISSEDPKYNDLSGTIANGISSGDGNLTKCRTVNDPDSSKTNIMTSTAMYKNYNVVGAIKTPYTGKESGMLAPSISESGRRLNVEYRGVGNPCFIYLEQQKNDEGAEENWSNTSEDIFLSYDKNNRYITKISFNIDMPAQKDTDTYGKYYPYNGWQLKQIGLYNDGKILIDPKKEPNNALDPNYYPFVNMPRGMLLAVKNISPFTKTAEASYKVTWTLSI